MLAYNGIVINNKNELLNSEEKNKVREYLEKNISEFKQKIAILDTARCKQFLPATALIALGLTPLTIVPFVGTISFGMTVVGLSQYARIQWHQLQYNEMVDLLEVLHKV